MSFLLQDCSGNLVARFASASSFAGELVGPNGGFVAHLSGGGATLPSIKDLRHTELRLVASGDDGEPFFERHLGVPLHCEVLNLGERNVEIALELHQDNRLQPETLALVQKWISQMPGHSNAWAPLSFHQRRAWLEVIVSNPANHARRRSTSNEVFLDTAFVDDYPSLMLALGEAVNGPLGYFGRSLDALDDCCGGYGIAAPFVLHIPGSERLIRVLDRAAWTRVLHYPFYGGLAPKDAHDGPSLFEGFCQVLEQRNVELTLE